MKSKRYAGVSPTEVSTVRGRLGSVYSGVIGSTYHSTVVLKYSCLELNYSTAVLRCSFASKKQKRLATGSYINPLHQSLCCQINRTHMRYRDWWQCPVTITLPKFLERTLNFSATGHHLFPHIAYLARFVHADPLLPYSSM